MDVKVIANYLPQYHRIPENDLWWGEGYTDWTAVRSAVPLFDGHVQPRVPQGGVYYSLDDVEAITWQADLARSAGIDGFGIYHYWFNSGQHLLGTPVELLLGHPEIDISYMLIWDNNSWKRTWSNVEPGFDWAPMFADGAGSEASGRKGLLAELKYGAKADWEAHFRYLLPFFRDSRYVKVDGKPVFAFMVPHRHPATLRSMGEYWNLRAIEEGLGGLVLLSKATPRAALCGGRMNYEFRYETLPPTGLSHDLQKVGRKLLKWERPGIKFYDYDREWRRILSGARKAGCKTFLSAIVDYDDTPRRGEAGSVMLNATPEKFAAYFKCLYELSIRQDKELLFVSAWNEWGEGMYLEPDERNGSAYLDALADVLLK